MRWPVGLKILSGYAAVILLIVGLIGLRQYSDAQTTARLEALYARGVQGTQVIGIAGELLHRIRTRTFHHVAAGDEDEANGIEGQIRALEQELHATLDTYGELLPQRDERRAQVQAIRVLYGQLSDARANQVIPLSRAGDVDGALDLLTRVHGPRFDAVVDALDTLAAAHLAESEDVYDAAVQAMHQASQLSLALKGVGIVLALLIAGAVSGDISSRLRHVSEIGGRVSRGELDARARVRGSDEISDVATALNGVTASLADKLEEQQLAARQQADERARLQAAVATYGDFIERVAHGELTARLKSHGEGELQALGSNLEAMGEALRTMTLRVHEAVGALSGATAEIGTTVQEHATSANETASAVAETAATVDEVQQSAERVTEHARQVHEVSRLSVQVSAAGRQAVEHTVVTMTEVREQVDGIAGRILSLSEQTQAVGHIITTVNELAERSNLLALNAAIEAARAGEAGAGFGVVAREIRTLADQSREATSHVRSILGDVQRSTTEAVLATEEGSKAVARAVDAVRGAGDRIEQLAASIGEAARAAEHILTAAQQQAQGVAQISQAMHAIDAASRQTVGGTRIIEGASRDLNSLAANLRDAVAQYRA